jgi:hypothetical protein
MSIATRAAGALPWPSMSERETGPHGVLSPDGSGAWHLAESPDTGGTLWGKLILYGARVRPWDETPKVDRYGRCMELDGESL